MNININIYTCILTYLYKPNIRVYGAITIQVIIYYPPSVLKQSIELYI